MKQKKDFIGHYYSKYEVKIVTAGPVLTLIENKDIKE